ncbi:hypothetical protein [Vibrio sp. R78045]|uniref:hypothetical protein n=1 Tax=Vibrio sp. R78045 TaxID=3093868 RepID=UPI0036F19FD3
MDNKSKPITLGVVSDSTPDPEATERCKEALKNIIHKANQSIILGKTVNGKPVIKRIK